MVCPKCGAELVEGQLICSNCNEEIGNSNQNADAVQNNDIYVPQSSSNYESNLSNDINNYNEYDSFKSSEDKKSSNSTSKIFSLVLVIILVVCIIIIVVYSKNKNNVDVEENQNESEKKNFVEQYSLLVKDIDVMLSNEQSIICSENCNSLFDYDEEKYNLEIIDTEEYYYIILKSNEDILLDEDSCSTLDNASCDNNKIIGRVYKNENK